MRILFALQLCLCLWLPAFAHGQSREVLLEASARAFFNQGLELADKKQYAAAAGRFRRALVIHPSPVITYNLASVLELSGEIVESLELLYALEDNQDAPEELRSNAAALRARIEPKLAHLTIHLHDPLQQSTRIHLDGIDLSPAQLSVPLPVDPGSHIVQLNLLEGRSLTRPTRIPPGRTAQVILDVPATLMPPPFDTTGKKQAGPVPTHYINHRTLLREPWFWVGTGGVLATTVATIAAAALSGSL